MGGNGFWSQTWVLMKKNFILKKRHPFGTAFELLLPVAFAALFLYFKGLIGDDIEPASLNGNTLNYAGFISDQGDLALAPDNAIVAEFKTFVENGGVYGANPPNIRVFDSEASLEALIESSSYDDSIAQAVVFKSTGAGGWDYALRLKVDNAADTNDVIDNGQPNEENYFLNNDYLVRLQRTVDEFILLKENGDDPATIQSGSFFEVYTGLLAFPEYKNQNFFKNVFDDNTLFLLIPYILSFTRPLSSIMNEKESKLKDGMKMMGLSEKALWSSWLFTYGIFSFFSSVLVTLVFSQLFSNAAPFLIFLAVFFYLISLLAQSFAFSTLWSSAKSASLWGKLFYFVCFFFGDIVRFIDAPQGAIRLFAMLPPTAYVFLLKIFSGLEQTGQGLTASTTNVKIDDVNYNTALGFMIFSIPVYALLTWYLGQVIKTDFGTTRPWYFPFLKSTWVSQEYEAVQQEGPDAGDNDNIQPLPSHLKGVDGVFVHSLRKEFGSGKDRFAAVDNLSLSMHEGEVFALLGHNGAGKTTALSMLTGLIPVTSGDATVFGKSVVHDIRTIQKMIGICPQHDVLFDDLTVLEHLRLFGSLKGFSGKELEAKAQEACADVSLQEKATSRSKTLSGGQKRRLSLAIAFVGDPRVVYLDEPTSGQDVHSRRATWDLIRKKKEGRVIVLTTHYMDEADLLGDRIAIMAKGNVVCCGTSLFLKSRYGVGYTLVLTSKQEKEHVGDVRAVLDEHLKTYEVVSHVGNELFLRVPFEESSQFPSLFRHLDRNKEDLQLLNYNVSVTTLEEVFLRADRELHKDDPVDEDEKPDIMTVMKKSGDVAQLGAFAVFFAHFKALLAKRFHHYKRDRNALLFQILIPGLFMAIGVLAQKLAITSSFPAVNLHSFAPYSPPVLTPVYEGALGPNVYTEFDAADVTIDKLDLVPNPIYTNGSTVSDPFNLLRDFLADFNEAVVNVTDAQTVTESPVRGAYADVTTFLGSSVNLSFIISSDYRAVQGIPIYMNALTNALLGDLGSTAEVTATNDPLPLSQEDKELFNSIRGFILTFYFMIAGAVIPSGFISYIVEERTNKSKHQQVLSGVSLTAYWMSNMVWDCLAYACGPMVVGIIVLSASGLRNFTENWGSTILVLFLFGFSIVPLTYIVSFVFQKPDNARMVTSTLFLLTGLVLVIASNIMDIIESTQKINADLKYLYRAFPTFCFGEALFEIVAKQDQSLDNLSPKVAGLAVRAMAVEAILFLGLVILCEYLGSIPLLAMRLQKMMGLGWDVKDKDELRLDEDVAQHAAEVQKGDKKEQIEIKGLRKVFGGKLVAVRDLWLAIPKGQCFGFLGVNGAGKTTALSMLTGDALPTKGTASLADLDVLADQRALRRHIGYCPQQNALFPFLTAREHLQFYARLKGVDSLRMNEIVDNMIHYLSLDEYKDRPAGTYSGGNKRKLSVAIALIGDPPIVFLDEISAGVDPVSRAFMWRFIAETMPGRSAILTTHSMEECEALCQRLSIMVAGSLRCLGTPQHIKNRFGRGFQLDLSVAASDGDAAVDLVTGFLFPDARVIERHDGSIKFSIPFAADLSLADIFERIEKEKKTLGVIDYAVGQTSLEQIFIQFASGDRDTRTEETV